MDGRKDVGIKPTQEESKNRSSENGGRAIMNYVANSLENSRGPMNKEKKLFCLIKLDLT